MVSAKTLWASYPQYHGRRAYHQLRNADVNFFPPSEYIQKLEIIHTDSPVVAPGEMLSQELLNPEWITDQNGTYARIGSTTGSLCFVW